jgi:hypothetical protein
MPIDVFITAAEEDVETAQMLESALAAAGMTSALDAGQSAVLSTVDALENCRSLVFILSPAANNAAHVVRALERASGRGVPVMTYATAAVAPTPSIAYFTGTVAPIRGWTGDDPARATAALVAACRAALQPPARAKQRTATGPTFSRATYADPRPLLAVLATVFVLCCLANVYAIVQDARTIERALAPAAGGQPAVPVDPASLPFLAPSATLWTTIIGSILVLRRARQNLIARFAQNVTVGAGELIWRPLVPFANVFWLPRMARDLRNAAVAARDATDSAWRLATIWRGVLIGSYCLVIVRDLLTRYSPENPGAIAALGMAVGVTCLALAAVTYAVWRSMANAVRQQPVAVAVPDERATALPLPAPVDVLILNEPEDDLLARTMVAQLDRLGSRCWRYDGEPRDVSFDGFQVILVIVSHASHASERIVSLVQSAIAARAHVVPVVLDFPPIGSPLGHYVRALHWLDAATVFVPGHDANLASVLMPAAAVLPPAIDNRVFTAHVPAKLEARDYRPAISLRRAAWAAAWLQIVVAAALGLLALVIAIDSENAGDPFGNLSILLVGFSLPAWGLFLAWLSRTQKNATALFVSGLASRRELLLKVGVPMISMVAGGTALSRLFASLLGRANAQVQQRATLLRRTWAITGVVFTACALLGSYLVAYHRLVEMAMVLSMFQAIAIMCRGLVRVKMISAVSAHFETRARVRTTSARTPRSYSAAQ